MQEGVVNRSRGRTSSDLLRTAAHFRWDREVRRLWLRDTFFFGGWSNQRPAPALIGAYSVFLLAGLAGYGAAAVVRGRRNAPVFASSTVPIDCAVLCLSFTAALGYHMVQSKLAWGQSTTGPWYACSALPWFLVLAAGGGLSWPIGRLRAALPIALALTCLATEWSVVFGRMLATYSGGASGWVALARIATLQQTMLGTPTLIAAAVGQAIIATVLILLWGTLSNEDLATEALPQQNPARTVNHPHLAVTQSTPVPN
jgi:hypothetical protein